MKYELFANLRGIIVKPRNELYRGANNYYNRRKCPSDSFSRFIIRAPTILVTFSDSISYESVKDPVFVENISCGFTC